MLSSRKRLAERQGQSGTPRHEYLQQLVSEYARSPHWMRKEEIAANLANFAYDPINYAAMRQLRVMELFVDIIATHGEENAFHTLSPSQAGVRTEERSDRVNRKQEESASVSKSKRLLVEFAMGGICNCIPDPILQISFIECSGVQTLTSLVYCVVLDKYTGAMYGDPGVVLSEPQRMGHQDQQAKSVFNTALSALTTTYYLLDSPAFAEVTSDAMVNHMTILSTHSNIQIANIARAFLSRRDELLASVSTTS